MPKTTVRQKKNTYNFMQKKEKMEPNGCDNESVENEKQVKNHVPQKSLTSYQEARELIRPLKDYIHRIENKQALARLREVESVIKYVIKNEKRPKKSNN